jgi:hypothetical protein
MRRAGAAAIVGPKAPLKEVIGMSVGTAPYPVAAFLAGGGLLLAAGGVLIYLGARREKG